MTQVTSGRVVYSRTVQPASYESERAEIEMAFVVGEDEDVDDVVSSVGRRAMKHAHEMLGIADRRSARRERRTRDE